MPRVVATARMSAPSGPNPFRVTWSILRALRSRRPAPTGTGAADHSRLIPILESLRRDGVRSLVDLRGDIREYRDHLAAIDPDTLSAPGALAYWLNLYNAGALDVAADAASRNESSVLRLPGAFQRVWVDIAGERLSLDAIEHGKIRRFGDPRVHAALVCGSASCPTLRYEPYVHDRVDDQLDDQLRSFLAAGGAIADRRAGTLAVSRVFLWYGGDFTRPGRMPAWLPPRRPSLRRALQPWLRPEVAAWVDGEHPRLVFQRYDWTLACSIG